ncbi:phenol hydroxylase [Neisseria sp. HMSC077D05]|jgi:phenol hydroxylase P0 protein|uniref:phenol hydroxylase subunit n=1 Tax=Neisseria TaxID=482 RepID=UPI00038065FC|nr:MULTISPECIES: phenol hydroxylase subunit [Neisseria]OFN31935.1 phenol hydroxylase [Neisseria sp. HMSC077D05]
MNMQTTAPARFVKYVRVRSESDARFVEFDFAINDPSLFVELIMPKDCFDVFCRRNEVVYMTEEQAEKNDEEAAKWRYGTEAELR